MIRMINFRFHLLLFILVAVAGIENEHHSIQSTEVEEQQRHKTTKTSDDSNISNNFEAKQDRKEIYSYNRIKKLRETRRDENDIIIITSKRKLDETSIFVNLIVYLTQILRILFIAAPTAVIVVPASGLVGMAGMAAYWYFFW